MAKFSLDIKKMTEKQAKEILQKIIEKLDKLDEEDFFGTEGWKRYFEFED